MCTKTHVATSAQTTNGRVKKSNKKNEEAATAFEYYVEFAVKPANTFGCGMFIMWKTSNTRIKTTKANQREQHIHNGPK